MNPKIKKIISGVIAVLVLGVVSNYTSITNYFDQQHRNIRNCAQSLKEQKLVGGEYSCAILEASKIYNQNKEKALQLCLEYSPMPDSPISKSSCKYSIEGRLKNK